MKNKEYLIPLVAFAFSIVVLAQLAILPFINKCLTKPTIQQLQAKYVKNVYVKQEAGVMVVEYKDNTLGFVPRDVPLYFRDGHLQGMVMDLKTKKWRIK